MLKIIPSIIYQGLLRGKGTYTYICGPNFKFVSTHYFTFVVNNYTGNLKYNTSGGSRGGSLGSIEPPFKKEVSGRLKQLVSKLFLSY